MLDELLQEEDAIASELEAEAARVGAAILSLPIRELPTLRAPVCVPPDSTVRNAVAMMNAHNAGCVLVEESGQLKGIFTERDVLTKIVGTALDLDAVAVEHVMTAEPESLSPDDRTSFALNKMTVGGFRHIPLVDDDGRPVGVVSMRNVVDYMFELFRTEVLNLPPTTRPLAVSREGA
jgi:CBS domain-containing protein